MTSLDPGRTAGHIELGHGWPIRSRDRVLALAMPDRRGRATVHHAYRTALALEAPFDVLWLRPPNADSSRAAPSDDLMALERLVTTLGGTLIVRPADELAAATRDVAAERGATHVVVGRPRRRTAVGRHAHRRLPLELMDVVPGADVQIVARSDV